MKRYIIKRFLSGVISLFLTITLAFFLMKGIPGDPFTQERALSKPTLEALYKHYKLDKPLYAQYGNYLKSIAQFDLGPSFTQQNRSVNDIIKRGFPISALLGCEALCIAVMIGMIFGTFGALWHNKWQDWLVTLFAVVGISIPSFILASFLQYFFAIKLHLFPIARFDSFSQSLLPALSLAALPTAVIIRLIRVSMIEVLQMDYIKTARSKGLSDFMVITKHAIKNALLPVISYLGVLAANILTGSFIIEKIFGIPGLGAWFINSITNRDYPMIMGITIFYSVVLLSMMFVVDLIYMKIDPRIKPT